MPPRRSRMHRSMVLLGLGAALQGCGSARPNLVSTVDSTAVYEITADEVVCVVQPADKSFMDNANEGSGEALLARTRKSIEKTGRQSVSAASLDACDATDARYSVVPRLMHYENRLAGVSGRPDKIKVKVSLHSIDPEQELNGFFLSTMSNLGSLMFEVQPSGPERLLDAEFDDAISALLDGKPVDSR